MTIEDTMRSYRGGGYLYSNAVQFCRDLEDNRGPYLDNNGLPLVLADGDWAIVKTPQMHLGPDLWVDYWEKETVLGDEDSYQMIVHMSNGESWVFNFKLSNDSYGNDDEYVLDSLFSGKPRTVTTTIWEKA